jgi:hypothetical protein
MMIRTEVFNQIGTAFVGDDARGEYEIIVDKSGPPAAQIDLSSFGRKRRREDDPCCGDSPGASGRSFRVGAGGYVSFYVSSGIERWATIVGDPGEQTAEFDSRRLQEGDMFAASVLRPGQYSVRNTLGDGRTELVVRAAKLGKEPYQPADPMRTKMAATAGRKSMRLGQAQGVVFTADIPMRVIIDLDKPFDD